MPSLTQDRPSGDDAWAQLRLLPTATLHEAAGRVGELPGAIQALFRPVTMAGPAYPVQVAPGDNLNIHRALVEVSAGDVLVVATGGAHDFGYWGEILAVAALKRGIAGLVIDGGVRDTVRLGELGLPVFSRGRCIRGTIKDPEAAGGVRATVTIGGVRVAQGDAVVGDEDGVVVLAADTVPTVVAAAWTREEKERVLLERLAAGSSTLEVLGLT